MLKGDVPSHPTSGQCAHLICAALKKPESKWNLNGKRDILNSAKPSPNWRRLEEHGSHEQAMALEATPVTVMNLNEINESGCYMSKLFYLARKEDESGISGTGRIAQGIVFDNGKVALTWLSDHPSVTIYDNLGEVRAIHGHEGKTEVIMEPDWKRAFNEIKSVLQGTTLVDVTSDKLPKDSETGELLDKNS
jgi:hypothetical protein